MTVRTKHIDLLPYDPAWPHLFETEAEAIKQALGDNCLAIHHIGSTAVPGLSAKQDIDMCCVMKELPLSLALEKIGYVFKGEFNIPLRFGFSKNTEFSKVNLHVVEPGHGFIKLNLCFRDHLRTHEADRMAYGRLKETLLKDPTAYERQGRFANYTLRKNAFIKDILTKAGFEELIVNFCEHTLEWEAAKRLRQQASADLENFDVWTFDHPEHVHLVLYQGTTIVGYAHIQRGPENRATIRTLVIDASFQNQGLEEHFLTVIKTWLKSQSFNHSVIPGLVPLTSREAGAKKV